MTRLVGIITIVLVLYGAVMASDPNARTAENHRNLAKRLGQYGVLTVGVGLLIVAGGIDLSIGSVVGLSAISLGLLLERRINPVMAVALVILGTMFIGLFHGLLVTRLHLQPFIATLCGLFIYRGLAQWATLVDYAALGQKLISFFTADVKVLARDSSRTVGIGGRDDLGWLREVFVGDIAGIPMTFVILAVIALAAAIFLHGSIYGRYFYAIGHNEQAARYAGIPTARYKVLSYVISSTLAGLGGVIFFLDGETASPANMGTWFELYAITGAVLGGCSLRGGQGTVLGMVFGTAVMPLLQNLCNFSGVPSDLQFAVIGAALLLGTIVDETLKGRGTASK